LTGGRSLPGGRKDVFGVGSTDRSCIDCRAPATWTALTEDGVFEGFVCKRCDRERRRERTGWRRRFAFRISRRFGI
jgi:hypothetical protein